MTYPTIPSKKSVCAVIVTYHPDNAFFDRIATIITQVSKLIIVDNHSQNSTTNRFYNLSKIHNIEYILNSENLGVATALNQGIKLAIKHRFDWVFLLDQDTDISNDIIYRLGKIYNTIDHKSTIGIIGCSFRDKFGIISPKHLNSFNRQLLLEVPVVISSGSLIATNTFIRCGEFRDDFFIDLVDTEYCLRLRSLGYKIYITSKPMMIHPIGNKVRHLFLSKHINVSNHSAIRKYYITRNRLIIARLYIKTELLTVFHELRDSFYSLITILLFEYNKTNKYKAILMGLFDAINGTLGKAPHRRLRLK